MDSMSTQTEMILFGYRCTFTASANCTSCGDNALHETTHPNVSAACGDAACYVQAARLGEQYRVVQYVAGSEQAYVRAGWDCGGVGVRECTAAGSGSGSTIAQERRSRPRSLLLIAYSL
jgi:hypothetical protein